MRYSIHYYVVSSWNIDFIRRINFTRPGMSSDRKTFGCIRSSDKYYIYKERRVSTDPLFTAPFKHTERYIQISDKHTLPCYRDKRRSSSTDPAGRTIITSNNAIVYTRVLPSPVGTYISEWTRGNERNREERRKLKDKSGIVELLASNISVISCNKLKCYL